MEFDDLVLQASDILDTVENYQWSLGQLANEVVETYGFKALVDFSKQIEVTGGVRRSPASLRMYAYVWKISDKLHLPKDILFSGCQAVVFSNDPQKYARLLAKGASIIDIKRQIYEEKTA